MTSSILRAISIRQPWAWLILHAGKDIENRCWPTRVRGRILVHAAKGMTLDEWGDAWEFARGSGASEKALAAGVTFRTIERGGIVGSVEIVDCVTESDSPWFVGKHGFVLRDPKPLTFMPVRGQLGFFEVEMPA
jgi:ASCH domain-containing protein